MSCQGELGLDPLEDCCRRRLGEDGLVDVRRIVAEDAHDVERCGVVVE